jgi:hypothetical protein
MAIRLWLNVASGKMFCSGSRFYGRTKSGMYVDTSAIGKVVPGHRTLKGVVSSRGGCAGLV